MPASYPLKIYRGDTWRTQFKLWQDAAKTQPLDLTDVEVKAEIRDKSGGAKIFPINCTVTLPNIIEGYLSPTETKALITAGVWDLQLTYPDTDVLTVLAGTVAVTDDVTDSTVVSSRLKSVA